MRRNDVPSITFNINWPKGDQRCATQRFTTQKQAAPIIPIQSTSASNNPSRLKGGWKLWESNVAGIRARRQQQLSRALKLKRILPTRGCIKSSVTAWPAKIRKVLAGFPFSGPSDGFPYAIAALVAALFLFSGDSTTCRKVLRHHVLSRSEPPKRSAVSQELLRLSEVCFTQTPRKQNGKDMRIFRKLLVTHSERERRV